MLGIVGVGGRRPGSGIVPVCAATVEEVGVSGVSASGLARSGRLDDAPRLPARTRAPAARMDQPLPRKGVVSYQSLGGHPSGIRNALSPEGLGEVSDR